jgi:hypothetical protein
MKLVKRLIDNIKNFFGNIHRKWQRYHARRIEKYWVSQGRIMDWELKDRIGMAYIEDYLGFDEQTTQAFIQGSHQAQHTIGMKQANLPYDSVGNFWDQIRRIFPHTYQDRDISFLKKSGGPMAICSFLNSLKTWGSSPVLHALEVNAHVYK